MLYTNDNLIGHSIYHYLIDSHENATRLSYADVIHEKHLPLAQTIIFNLINKDISAIRIVDLLNALRLSLQRCQQRLEYDGPGGSGDVNILEAPEALTHGPMSTLEQHLQRILGHLNTMHTISSVAWRQRPHHGIWLTRRLKRTEY